VRDNDFHFPPPKRAVANFNISIADGTPNQTAMAQYTNAAASAGPNTAPVFNIRLP
jgi:hypothetical protein